MSDNTTLQYLTFGLGEEVFALETGSVREVIELEIGRASCRERV